MDNRCNTCRHFRPYRPLSQLLASELGTEHPEALSELIKIMQDERERRDEEAGLKVKLLGDRAERWPLRPQMSSWCALEADEDRALFTELKNRGGRCPDHAPREDAAQPCATCLHRRHPPGPARDQVVLAQLAQLGQDAAVLGQAGSGPKAEDYRKRVGTTIAYEATQTYYLGKISLRAPEYLSVCQHFSTATDFVPCAAQNPHDACPKHVPTAPGLSPPSAAPALPTEAPPSPAAGDPAPGLSIPLPDWR